MLTSLLLTLSLFSAKASETLHLKYSSGVPAQQSRLLEKDLAMLDKLKLVDPDGEMARIYHLQDVKPDSVKAWLKQRAQAVIDPNHPLDDTVLSIQPEHVTYPYPGLFPDTDDTANEDDGGHIVMANVGSEMYVLGKQNLALLGFDMQGVGTIKIWSSEAGIFMIGPGLFETLDANMPASAVKNRVHSIFRLSTLFHEARHGDGHGPSLEFPHSMCPVGHDYQEINACDIPANGPYRVGALFVKAARDGCTDCTAGEKETLSALFLDFQNRILSPLRDDDSSPAAKTIPGGAVCKKMQEEGVVAPFCDQAPRTGPRVEWDDAPESLR